MIDIFVWILAWWCVIWVSSGSEGKVLQSVEHRQISDSEVLVTWQLVPGQALSWNYKVSYTYRMAQIGDCRPLLQSQEVSVEAGPWQSALTLRGLAAWRSYRYKLKASPRFFREEDLLTGLFATRPTEVPRQSVQKVHVQNVSSRSADLSWQEPACPDRNGPLRRFDVQLSGPSTPLVLNAYTGLYVTLGNLLPATPYMVRVRYVNTVGPSDFTAPVNFTTAGVTEDQEQATPGGEVERKGDNDQASAAAQTTERRHGPPSEDADSAAKTPNRGVSGGGRLQGRVGGTMAGKMAGRTSRAVCGTIDSPCAPVDLKMVDSTFTCVTLAWRVSFPNVIKSYDVYDCTEDLNLNHLSAPRSTPPVTKTKLCDLEAGRYYTFAVRSRSRNDNVSNLVTVRAHTMHTAPPPPAPPKLIVILKTSIQIHISPVSSSYGPVTSYYVIVETVLLSEEERVNAGVASGPTGYIGRRPVTRGSGVNPTGNTMGTMALQGDGSKDQAAAENYKPVKNPRFPFGAGQNGRQGQLPPAPHQIPVPAQGPVSPGDSGTLGQIGHNGKWDQAASAANYKGRLGQAPSTASQNQKLGQAPSSKNGGSGPLPSGTRPAHTLGQASSASGQNGRFHQMPAAKAMEVPGASDIKTDNSFVNGRVDSSLRAPHENRVKNSAEQYRGPVINHTDGSLSEPASSSTTANETGAVKKSGVPYLIVRRVVKQPNYRTEDRTKEADLQTPETEQSYDPSAAYPYTETKSSEERQTSARNGQVQSETGQFQRPSVIRQKFKIQKHTVTFKPPTFTVSKVKYSLPVKTRQSFAVQTTRGVRDGWKDSAISVNTGDAVDSQVTDRKSLSVSGDSETDSVSSKMAVVTAFLSERTGTPTTGKHPTSNSVIIPASTGIGVRLGRKNETQPTDVMSGTGETPSRIVTPSSGMIQSRDVTLSTNITTDARNNRIIAHQAMNTENTTARPSATDPGPDTHETKDTSVDTDAATSTATQGVSDDQTSVRCATTGSAKCTSTRTQIAKTESEVDGRQHIQRSTPLTGLKIETETSTESRTPGREMEATFRTHATTGILLTTPLVSMGMEGEKPAVEAEVQSESQKHGLSANSSSERETVLQRQALLYPVFEKADVSLKETRNNLDSKILAVGTATPQSGDGEDEQSALDTANKRLGTPNVTPKKATYQKPPNPNITPEKTTHDRAGAPNITQEKTSNHMIGSPNITLEKTTNQKPTEARRGEKTTNQRQETINITLENPATHRHGISNIATEKEYNMSIKTSNMTPENTANKKPGASNVTPQSPVLHTSELTEMPSWNQTQTMTVTTAVTKDITITQTDTTGGQTQTTETAAENTIVSTPKTITVTPSNTTTTTTHARQAANTTQHPPHETNNTTNHPHLTESQSQENNTFALPRHKNQHAVSKTANNREVKPHQRRKRQSPNQYTVSGTRHWEKTLQQRKRKRQFPNQYIVSGTRHWEETLQQRRKRQFPNQYTVSGTRHWEETPQRRRKRQFANQYTVLGTPLWEETPQRRRKRQSPDQYTVSGTPHGEETQQQRRRKRRLDSSSQGSEVLPPGQIVAELMEVGPAGLSFLVGDGKVYNGYKNTRLNPSSRYRLYVVANSKVETTAFSVSKPIMVSMPLEPTTANFKANDRRDNVIVICVFCLVALLVLILMICLKCLQYGDRSNTGTQGCCACSVPDQFFMMDDDFPTNNPPARGMGESPLLSSEHHWTETYSLSEPRSILTGRELLPPSQTPLPNPNPDRPVGSEPITFLKEFHSLPRPNPSHSTLAGRRHPEMNNSPSALPFDATRVLLDNDGSGDGDYINASYITGYMDENGVRSTYIAAQCPFDERTAVATWRLIQQQGVCTVVVLHRTIEDGALCCLQFWPELGQQERGPYVIQTMDQFTYAHYTEVVVSVRQKKRGNDVQVVRLFCFTSWPENGVPQDAIPLVEFCTRVHKSQRTNDRPVLVQCGTGSGRTAVFIAVDILLAQYAAEHQASVYDVVCAMRSERPFMVQTFPQYLLVYEAVLEEMHAGDTWVSEDLQERYRDLNRHNPNTGRTYLRDQFILLETMLNQYSGGGEDSLSMHQRPSIPTARGAPPDVVPAGRGLPQPRSYSNANYNSNVDHWPHDGDATGDDDHDSIAGLENLVYVDGYRRRSQFHMARTPLPVNVADFWRHVYDYDIRSIVMMQDQDCSMSSGGAYQGEYWPPVSTRTWEPFQVVLLDTECDHCLTVRTLQLLHRHRVHEEAKVVRQFHFHGWNPPPPEESTHQPSAAQWDGYGSRGQGIGGGGQQADRTRSNLPPTEGRWRGSQECPPPSARSTLLTLCDKVKQWQLEVSLDSTPILVHCRNGAQCSGLFVAASLMTSRMDEENLVSVYRTCRALRKLCPRAVGNFEQYKFQYKALWDYINQPPTGVGTRDCGVSSLDSPDPEYKRGWGETPTEESRRPSYQYGDSYSYRTPKSDLPPDRERHVCEIAEPTETEEEQTEGSATRVSDYYSVSTTPRPLLHHHQYHPHHQRYSSTTSASNNDAYNNHRFSPLQHHHYPHPQPHHSLPPRLTDRPPRQERGGGGTYPCHYPYPSPRRTPTPSRDAAVGWWGGWEETGGGGGGGGATPPPPPPPAPRTSTRNRPRSSLAVSSYPAPSPSPLPRVRTHSLSPIHRSGGEPGYGYGYAPCTTPTTTTTTSPSRRRRREREKEMERRRRRSGGNRRSSTTSSMGEEEEEDEEEEEGGRRGRGAPLRRGGGGGPVRSEAVVEERTEVEVGGEGVVYRQRVTDTLQDLSTSTRSESDG